MKNFKFKYIYKHIITEEILTEIFTIKQLETMDDFEILNYFGNDFELIARTQYIEVKDKHDKEIYESDLIKVSTNEEWVFKIVWDDYYSAFKGINIFDEGHDIIPGQYQIELIGNLFENPEIMEENL